MSLRLALVIDGNATGARNATEQTTAGLKQVEQAAGSATGKVSSVGREMTETAQVADLMANALAAEGKAFNLATRAANENATALKARNAAAINARIGVQDNFNTESRAADIQAYGRELDALRAKYNPFFALEQRRAVALAEIDRAHRLGAISSREMANAIKAEEAAFQRSVAAINSATTALQNNKAVAASAATASTGANQFNTANIAAQIQDVAVTSAMGMNPLQIALQQGTQISAVFGNMGAAGAVKTLAGAFLSVVSPVSLVTIGVTALAAVGLQAFGNMMAGAEDATDALERHNDMLDRVLEGYDGARKAADNALASALKLPQGVVTSDLQASIREQDKARQEIEGRIEALRNQITTTLAELRELQTVGVFGAMAVEDSAGMQQIEMLRQLTENAAASRQELEEAAVAARELSNSTDDPAIKEMADQTYELAMQLMLVQAQADSAGAALRALPTDIQVRISMGQEFGSSLEGLKSLYVDPRSRFDVDREKAKNYLDQMTATSQSYDQIVGAASEYERIITSIDKAEAEANAKANARASKQVSDFQRQIESTKERTQALAIENLTIGQSTFVIEKARTVQELENAAKKDAIGLSAARVSQIQAEAGAYALAAAQQEKLREAQQAWEEQINFNKQVLGSFLSDIKQGLTDGNSIWEAFGKAGANALDRIADRALSMAADGIFDMIANAFGASVGGGGGGIGGFIGSIFGGGGLKLGYQAGVLHTGGSVGSPPMARMVPAALFDNAPRFHTGGRLGPGERPIIAMEGEEIGWPDQLARKYGGGFSFAPTNIFQMPAGAGRAEFEAMLDERDRVLNEQFASRVADAIENPRRR